MKTRTFFSISALCSLFLFLSIGPVSAVNFPDLPKPTIPSIPSIPSVPIPGKADAVEKASAQTFDERVANQERRIDDRLRAKQLTQAEAKTLQENLVYVKQREKRLKADGSLSPKDTEWLTILLGRNGRMIDGKKTEPVKPMKDVYYEMRFEQHQKWIDQGMASGELTKEEAKEVKDDLEKIKAAYARASKDGKLDSDERERLDERLSHNTRMIEKRTK
jgi:hypothetical protein